MPATEVAPVNLVHRGEVVHVREVDRGADDAVERAAGGFEDPCQIAEDAVRLHRDVTVHHRAGCRVERDLSRDEDQRAGAHRLRIGTDRGRGRRRRDRLAHGGQAALTTLPERRQRVQTRRRWIPPFTSARTRWRFGSNRRGVTLCAWLMLRPTTGPFPQSSQRFAMIE